jgi:hypothetical protein
VVVTYGRRCPAGYLPAFSVDTEEEAQALIERCCELVWIDDVNTTGYIASELEEKQTLDNLYAFGARLEAEYVKMKERKP